MTLPVVIHQGKCMKVENNNWCEPFKIIERLLTEVGVVRPDWNHYLFGLGSILDALMFALTTMWI